MLVTAWAKLGFNTDQKKRRCPTLKAPDLMK
jgi:hypothetical protein